MQTGKITVETVCHELKKTNPAVSTETIRKAYEFASHVHKNQLIGIERSRLEHAVNASQILAEIGMDESTVAAAMLHDTIGFGHVETQELEKLFGKEIAGLVEEYTKERELEDANFEKVDSALLSKIVLAAAKDIRSLLINIASTIDFLEKGGYAAAETIRKHAVLALNIYGPICHKLGLIKLEWQVEDVAFRHLYKQEYNEIKEMIKEKRSEREKIVENAGTEIADALEAHGIKAFVQARAKSFYSTHKKMKRKPFNEIYDLLGVRIICDNEEQCYKSLGLLHAKYKTIEHKFRDYITDPKKNRYKSIHTIIIFQNKPIEAQIRTWQMHWNNEIGLASHWQYKKFRQDKHFDQKLSIISQIMEWHKTHKNQKELVQSLSAEGGEERIFVFTPKRETIIVKEGSTALDFAFAVHSDIGLRAKATKVNSKIAPFNHEIENGDTVEVLVSSKSQVKRHWLSFVKSDKAKTKIKQALGIKEPHTVPKKMLENVKVTTDLKVKMARCCKPLPGDEIIGYRTTKRKIAVHRKNCENMSIVPETKKVIVAWAGAEENYSTELKILAKESPSLIPELLKAFSENGIKINSTRAKTNKNHITSCIISVRIQTKSQLDKAVREINKLPFVIAAGRS